MGEVQGEPGASGGAKKKPSGAQRRKEQKAKEEAIAASRMAQEATEAAAKALPVGDEDDLAAMRHVMNTPVDRTYQHWSYRQWLKEDPGEFRKKLASLARAATLASGTSSASPAASCEPPGSGTNATPSSPTGHIPPVLKELLAPEFAEIEEYHRHREEFQEWKASRGPAGP